MSQVAKQHWLMSEIKITPMSHRLPDRIRAYAPNLLHRAGASPRDAHAAQGRRQQTSPERALALLRQLQRHRVHLPDEQTVTGFSTISAQLA